MIFDLSGKVAMVTGGGRGIGRGIAKLFASQGAKVVVATRTRSHGEVTVAEIKAAGHEAHLIVTDIAKKENCFDAVAKSVAAFGDLDILVHNAAAFPFNTVPKLTDSELQTTIDTNLMASVWLAQAAWPYLIGKRDRGGGRLIYVTSLAGLRTGMPGMAHYGASKAGVYGFALGAAAELARHGATVNVVEPGLTRGDTFQYVFPTEEVVARVTAEQPMGRIVEAEDIALACLYFALPQASAVTAQYLSVDCGKSLCDLPDDSLVESLSDNADKLTG
jgi:3-oxoacyl-[acyl-carrier protein] reductase